MSEVKPWECPRCGQVNAPHVTACTCKPAFRFLPLGPVQPVQPWPQDPLNPPWSIHSHVEGPTFAFNCNPIANNLATLGAVWVGETKPDLSAFYQKT